MRSFFGDLAGGAVLMIVATVIGIVHNAVRSDPVQLMQNARPVSTVATHDGGGTAGSTPASGVASALPEGAVGVDDVKKWLEEGTVVVIDARSPSAFEEGHIPGSINIPYDRLPEYLETLSAEVTPDQRVVCYCWGPTCDFSDQLATELKFMGYENVVVFTGGWEEWTAAGHPTEGRATE